MLVHPNATEPGDIIVLEARGVQALVDEQLPVIPVLDADHDPSLRPVAEPLVPRELNLEAPLLVEAEVPLDLEEILNYAHS